MFAFNAVGFSDVFLFGLDLRMHELARDFQEAARWPDATIMLGSRRGGSPLIIIGLPFPFFPGILLSRKPSGIPQKTDLYFMFFPINLRNPRFPGKTDPVFEKITMAETNANGSGLCGSRGHHHLAGMGSMIRHAAEKQHARLPFAEMNIVYFP